MSLIIKMDPIMTEEHLKKAIPYVINVKKTGGLAFSNVGVDAPQITEAFMRTKQIFHTRGKRQGYHFKFSFSKDESITPEQAFEFVKEWAEEYLGDEYDYVTSVHKDREHVHMHLVFNSVNHSGKKYNFAKGDWNRHIKPLTNRLAEKYHTGPLKEKDPLLDYSSDYDKKIENHNKKRTNASRLDNLSKRSPKELEHNDITWKKKVQKDLDSCIKKSKSYKDFKRRLQMEYHYKLREGVSKEHGIYLALTPPGKAKAIRTYRLGDAYMPAQIEKRIIKDRGKSLDWKVMRTAAYIPYENLSEYQKMQVRKMLEARRLYRRTNASLQLHEQSVRAIKGLMQECQTYRVQVLTLELPKKQKIKKVPEKEFLEQMTEQQESKKQKMEIAKERSTKVHLQEEEKKKKH